MAALPKRMLGRTGHQVSVIGLGGQAVIEEPHREQVAIPIIERALDLGVNYLDTAAEYGGEQRWSQRYIGEVMKRRRAQVFLASKTHHRSRDGSLRLLEESLRLLQTDHLDLWQIHNLDRMEKVDQIFGHGGAMEALVQARDQEAVRFLGVTGHADPRVLIEAIRRFPFDTILMALNAADKHYLSFMDSLLPLVVEKGMGIMAMKVAANGRLVANSGTLGWKNLGRLIRSDGKLSMREALGYVLSLPVSTAGIGCSSIAELEENVGLARAFTPLTDEQKRDLEARTRPAARELLYFRNWA